MKLRKAARKQAKLRIGLSAPSWAWKTYSALKLAYWITWNWDKVALIDTENWSWELYSDLWEYNVLSLSAPFSPERYIEAITECENAWIEVIIVDSISHEWEWSGWCLDINDKIAQAKFKWNTWAAWSETTPRHQSFINKIVTSDCHIITTVRNKIESVQEWWKIKKVWTKELTREWFEYELTVNFNIDREQHLAVASKDRTWLFIDKDPFLINEETWKDIIKWNQSWEKVKTKDENFSDIIEKLNWCETIDSIDLLSSYIKWEIEDNPQFITKEKLTELWALIKTKKEELTK